MDNLFQAPDQPEADNDRFALDQEGKEGIAEIMLGMEQGALQAVEEDNLDQLIQRLTVENVDTTVDELVSSFREMDSNDHDIIEAMRVNLGFNLSEAKEVYKESKKRLHLV